MQNPKSLAEPGLQSSYASLLKFRELHARTHTHQHRGAFRSSLPLAGDKWHQASLCWKAREPSVTRRRETAFGSPKLKACRDYLLFIYR